jgi:hypothetical protein
MTAPAGRSAIVSGMASILAHLTGGDEAEAKAATAGNQLNHCCLMFR